MVREVDGRHTGWIIFIEDFLSLLFFVVVVVLIVYPSMYIMLFCIYHYFTYKMFCKGKGEVEVIILGGIWSIWLERFVFVCYRPN